MHSPRMRGLIVPLLPASLLVRFAAHFIAERPAPDQLAWEMATRAVCVMINGMNTSLALVRHGSELLPKAIGPGSDRRRRQANETAED